jgi:DNA-binding NarL/FixJ family response regulator
VGLSEHEAKEIRRGHLRTARKKGFRIFLRRGLIMEEISTRMILSFDTIKFRGKDISKKFKVKHTPEAILTAVNIGLI